ncbi:MAG: GIY-YIG nuclease family protein [Bacteroidota bacterium]
MTNDIIKSISKTLKPVKDLNQLPDQQGIYAFYLDETSELGKFGKPGQLIYVGLSEKNINSRDTKSHLQTGQTGWSTLRRSIGAILKTKLNLEAKKRDINPKRLRADKYKFDEIGEDKLTKWMIENLKMGYWSTSNNLTKEKLRDEEEKVILKLKPTLDLDKRTKKFNPLAPELDALRAVCRKEVKDTNQDI